MLSDYNIINEIGKGGMGCVYLATHNATGRKVALKMMSNQMTCYPEYRELFRSEVETLKLMNNPSVVHIEGDCFSDEKGNLYLPMEFVEGPTIDKIIKNQSPYAPPEAVSMMIKILKAIEYIHQRGKIHRDIKPSNIIIRPDGSICVIDFGIAKDIKIGSSGKTIGVIIGTDGYMSPEQANGYNIDHRTDIYSLGCLLFYMLTGKDAVTKESNSYATRLNILNTVMTPPSQYVNVPAELDQVYLKAVDKNMVNRYQDARSFRKALERIYTNSTDTNTWTVEIGKEADNDIVVSSQYVSRHHLTVTGIIREGQRIMIVKDHSSNGIGINGRKYHNETIPEIVYDDQTDFLPQIFLAGLPELAINWDEVTRILENRGWKEIIPPPPPPPEIEGLSLGIKILCILFPIVGWILWAAWKTDYPEKASCASKCSWIGFGVNILLSLLLAFL